LREPLENGEVHISRARGQVTFPARFQLVAAMNASNEAYSGGHQNKVKEKIRLFCD
jgi:magnesium chelatase family protein